MSLLRVLVVLGLVLVVFQTPQGQPSSTAGAAPVCDWNTEYYRTLTELGENETDWRIVPLDRGRGGQALMDQGRVEIDPAVDCADLPSIVIHEWVHLQQARVYGSQHAAVTHYGSVELLEVAADCGALLLGATYTPYLPYPARCPSAGLTRNARFLIAYGR